MADILLTTFSNAFSWKCLNCHCNPDSKVHGANMGPTWVLSAPDGPHVGPMNFAIREFHCNMFLGFRLRVIIWHWTGNKLLSESMMSSLQMHICVGQVLMCSIYINGLAQDCSNYIANALELLQHCTKPSIWSIDISHPWKKFVRLIWCMISTFNMFLSNDYCATTSRNLQVSPICTQCILQYTLECDHARSQLLYIT